MTMIVLNIWIEYGHLKWSICCLKTGVGISAMFVVVECIGYTINVVASRTPCDLVLVFRFFGVIVHKNPLNLNFHFFS